MASEIKVDTISEKTSAGGVTIDGLLIKDGNISGDVALAGTTPTFTIGDAGAEDAALVFDGNAQDYHVGLDDSSDSLVIGLGSALGTTPAMTVNASQVVTFAQNPVFPDGGVAVADLDIDGATDIGAAIVDADLFIVDDGAGGTNRKVTASRIKTYAGGAVTAINNATANELVTIGATTTELEAEANLTFTGSALTCIGTITVGINDTGHDVKFFGATSGSYLLWDESADDLILTNGDIRTADEYGLIFGDGGDGQYTTNLNMRFDDSTGYPILDLSHGAAKTTNGYSFSIGTGRQDMYCTGVESGMAIIRLRADENDDNGDEWIAGMQFTAAGGLTDELGWIDNDSGSYDLEMNLTQAGVLTAEGAMNASTNIDYAEYFEWKTALADDQAIQDTYGLTVVLDNDKVRLAEAGEESNVLGVVRPNNTSAIIGGSQNFHWKDRYLTDVWGQTQYEQYTQCDWDENRMNNNGKTSIYHHKYMKDRIPAKRIKPEGGDLNKSEPNWHTLEHNFFRDNDGNFVDLIVPTTDEEKAAAGYRERNVYRRDKGVDGKRVGDPLMRKAVNPDYVPQQDYVPRDKRRKEWCVVGLLGQVPIRDTAIVPTSWKLMKNIESGVDLYYIK